MFFGVWQNFGLDHTSCSPLLCLVAMQPGRAVWLVQCFYEPTFVYHTFESVELSAAYYCAEGASCSATPGFKWLVSVCSLTDMSDFYRLHMRRLHPVFPLLAFQLGFSGIPEIHEKTAKSRSGSDPVGPCFGTLFCYFFLKKFSFSLEG